MQELLELDMADAVKGTREVIPFIDDLDPEAAEVLVEMAYQMGEGGLRKFKKMKAALSQDPPDYETAAAEILDSKMAREQTPERAEDYADRMRSLQQGR